jgi:holliday junction resolvase Hjr
MSQKAKGTNAERELIHLLWKRGYAAIRVAGSGSSHYPSPDIVAGNIQRKLAIECKSVKGTVKYLPKEEVLALQQFCSIFGCEPWIGIRFARNEWFFVAPEDLRETSSSYMVSTDTIKLKGLLLDELLK